MTSSLSARVQMEIRAAVREDVSAIAGFIREQAGKENSHMINEDALINDGFENDPLYGCFLCKVDGVPVSCAVHTRLYSTWEGRMMFICGMFTKSTLSSQDEVQKALIRHCAKVAVAKDCCRCDLILPRDDTASVSWYNQLGAISLNEWIGVWFSRTTLTKFISEKSELEKKVKNKYLIRSACTDDVSTILYLIQLLAEFELEPDAVEITEKELLRDGFGEDQYFSCFVAVAPQSNNCSPLPKSAMSKQRSDSMVHDNSIVSFALYFITYSALEGKVLHLEDLFVHSEHRGQGLGTVMMRECAQVALSRGCCRMQLNVLDWNTKARDLYVHIGGVCHSDLLQIRFTRPMLELLASEQ